ncbi:hypothetical protein ABG067_001959 [Albugo candida]
MSIIEVRQSHKGVLVMDPNETLRLSKAKYDQCFDQWYKEVFLQQRANGKLGCENEYKAYSNYLMSEMEHDKTLINNNSPPDEEGKYLKKNAKRNIAKYKEDSYSEALEQTKEMVRLLEAQVSYLKVSQEKVVLKAKNGELQLSVEHPLRCRDHLSDALRRMEEEIELVVCHYVPLQYKQIQYARIQAFAEICQILSDPNYQTIGTATLGWVDRRKMETINETAVKFVFEKTFVNVSPLELYQRTWKKMCDAAILRDFFSPALMLRKHVLQQIDDDTFVTYRVIYNRQNREITRAVELSYRTQKGDDYYLITQSVNVPSLTKCLDKSCPWSKMLTWIKLSPIAELEADACRFQYGGRLANITADGARYWLMEILLVVFRYER